MNVAPVTRLRPVLMRRFEDAIAPPNGTGIDETACAACGRESCEGCPAPDDGSHQRRVDAEVARLRVRREAERVLKLESAVARPDPADVLLDDVQILAVPEPPMLVSGRLPADALGLVIAPSGLRRGGDGPTFRTARGSQPARRGGR